MPSRQDWSKWEKERKDFAERGTEGFTDDLKALKAHVLKLQNVCPKDEAG